MSARGVGPAYDFWHPRVEGQIRDAMNNHPEWWGKFKDEKRRMRAVTSIAKRIVGEIVVVVQNCCPVAGRVTPLCPSCGQQLGEWSLPSDGGGMVRKCSSAELTIDREVSP